MQEDHNPPAPNLHRSGTTPSQPRAARSPASENVPLSRPRGLTESSKQSNLQPRPLSPRSQIFGRNASPNAAARENRTSNASEERESSQATRRSRVSTTNTQTFVSPGLRQRGTWTTLARNRTIRRRPTVLVASGQDADGIADEDFTLAGPPAIEVFDSNQPYVDPRYADLNPAYDQPVNSRPVWGLAKPLPRVVRARMVPTRNNSRIDVSAVDGGRQEEQPDLEQGRPEPGFRMGRLESLRKQQNARLRREESLTKKFSRTNSWVPSVASAGPPLGRVNTSLDLQPFSPVIQAIQEEDPAFMKLGGIPEGLPSLTEEGEGGTTPPHYPNDASAATTEQEDDGHTDGEWHEDDPFQAYEGIDDEIHNFHTSWSVIRLRFREPLAELLAVTVQLTIGFCANLSVATTTSTATNGDTTAWAWGLATMIGIYIAGGISGAHLNPSISIMLSLYRGFPFRRLPLYILAQLLGAFIAALVAFGIYQNDIIHFGGASLGDGGTLSSFITYPRNEWTGESTAFFNEFTATTILAIAVLALGDNANAPPGAGMSAFVIGLVITALSIAFGSNTGCAMNPARDLAPRLATLMLGYGSKNTFETAYWVWGPWCATVSGALFGGLIYDGAIFVGGESPVNYPRRRIKRSAGRWRGKRAGREKL
ncbi:aquaporin-like protein [Amylocarpus encephaloides]|uniref:Aquaporin-like protein n=1 Tax=Amylocarpus encephaloides TaxID=45428 RepID=A0A9P8CAB0_9HELO|nr:aquaporin-like protein [Amylocarpus encephaloides]